MSGKRQHMTRDTVPNGFTVPMALMDLLPVLFFGGTGLLLGAVLGSRFVEICAVLVFLSGLLKVIWKMIAAIWNTNIWPLFVQMRIVMPVAFLTLIAGCVVCLLQERQTGLSAFFLAFPQLLFFLLGIAGLVLMGVCAAKLDSTSPRANWLEQAANSFAQGFLFLGMLFTWLAM